MRAAVTAGNVRTVITPPGRPRFELAELWRLRAICLVLTKRSLMVRYRQTIIGASWALIQPLTMVLVFTVFFGILSKFPTEDVPYAVFVYIGLMIWMVVSKVIAEGSTSVAGGGDLIKKIYFPRVYLPISVALSSLVDFAFGLLALSILLLFFGYVPGWHIIFVPLLFIIALAGAVGASLWLSALNAEYRDVAQLLPFITQLWFFLTPIIYSSTIIPDAFRPFFWLNPIALTVDGFRWALVGTSAPPLAEWALGGGMAMVLLVTGYVFFRLREPGFADVV